jgi:hypothetical protein
MRLFSLFAISIVFGLSLGFLVGRSSDERLKKIGLEPRRLLVLTTRPELFSPEVIQHYRKSTGFLLVPEKVKNIDELFIKQSRADLFLVPTSWIENKAWASKIIEEEVLLKNSVSPDFLTLTHQEAHTIPYLWSKKITPQATFVEILSLYYPEKIENSVFYDSIEGFFDSDLIIKFIEKTNFSTTLMSLDNSQLPREKKALSLRDLELKKLKINSD